MKGQYDESGSRYRPDTITKSQFDIALSCYQPAIDAITSEKKDLASLDDKRYNDLPKKYSCTTTDDILPLEQQDVVTLVEWKLKHGTFRPGLLQKAQSNSASDIKDITHTAFKNYQNSNFSVKEAIKTLGTLTGIGPATASLLLSIHDPARVPFFSDEVFLWLCRGGKKDVIKYTAKEYNELVEEARRLMKRLDVTAVQVEQVAFALMRYPCHGTIATSNTSTGKRKLEQTEAAPLSKRVTNDTRRESTEDQKTNKTRVGDAEIRTGDAKRLKSAANNTTTRTSPRKKLQPAETTGPAGIMNKAATEVLENESQM